MASNNPSPQAEVSMKAGNNKTRDEIRLTIIQTVEIRRIPKEFEAIRLLFPNGDKIILGVESCPSLGDHSPRPSP
jgi:hypothetical protein